MQLHFPRAQRRANTDFYPATTSHLRCSVTAALRHARGRGPSRSRHLTHSFSSTRTRHHQELRVPQPGTSRAGATQTTRTACAPTHKNKRLRRGRHRNNNCAATRQASDNAKKKTENREETPVEECRVQEENVDDRTREAMEKRVVVVRVRHLRRLRGRVCPQQFPL